MIVGLDHVVVLTGDIAAGEAAYQSLFARTPAWKNSGDGADRVLFTLDNMSLELMAPSGDGPNADRIRSVLAAQGEGLASLCFRTDDIVNVVGTSTCIIGITPSVQLVPGVCGVVNGSVHPGRTGIEAGLSAVGDIFNAIATRAGTDVQTLSRGLESYRAGQTGLLRMTWDNGDRTVLVNPNLRGVTLGWNLQTTAQDELFAAIEGTAFHTRVILDRMAENGVHIKRVINGGGIPQKNDVLNQVYANVLGLPVLVPSKSVVSLGSAIFAFLAAGTFKTVEQAQEKICPAHKVYQPAKSEHQIYGDIYPLYRKLYFALGEPGKGALGDVLPSLIKTAEAVNRPN